MDPDNTQLTEDEISQVNGAIAAAGEKTSAAIVPVVSSRSHKYDLAEDMVGWWAAALGLALAGLLVTQRHLAAGGERSGPQWVLRLGSVLVVILCGWILGMLAARHVWWLRRLFIPRKVAQAAAARRAEAVFQGCRLRAAAAGDSRPIVLIFVSLAEQFVTIIASQDLEKEIAVAAFAPAEAAVAEGMAKQRTCQGLSQAVGMVAELLAMACPPAAGRGEGSEVQLRVMC